jgi:hypothetical protein
MKRSHPAFWVAGWAGVVAGLGLAAIGLYGSSDVAGLAGGYGVLVLASSLYLLAGLGLRRRFGQRTTTMGPAVSAGRASAGSASGRS